MTRNEAERAGVAAYRAGKPAAPCLNQQFIEAACASGKAVELLKAYLHGWHIANLAACEELEEVPGKPSTLELARIES